MKNTRSSQQNSRVVSTAEPDSVTSLIYCLWGMSIGRLDGAYNLEPEQRALPREECNALTNVPWLCIQDAGRFAMKAKRTECQKKFYAI
ncbi:hypothetical protein OUZ56_025140 [Daphnia magna]|uniref:Uncharacterized protein n=1 Tax=Daphnia magna TaxID=35525 RepID=A0ABQ9ZIZ3_9CRUS|nr:hypothetical protein OUZ56_025140 [Daphnia magna]